MQSEDVIQQMTLSWNTAHMKRIDTQQRVMQPTYCISHKGGKSVDNEGDFVEK